MLDTLTDGFKSARLKLAGKTRLSEDNIAAALTDVRRSLLEADVELGVTRTFLERVRTRSIGEVVSLKAPTSSHGVKKGTKVTPADHFIKICHDELVALMGPKPAAKPPKKTKRDLAGGASASGSSSGPALKRGRSGAGPSNAAAASSSSSDSEEAEQGGSAAADAEPLI